ncbi:MAG: ankyrin repeat domain-containing protein [Bacteroidetes bacterium]|nr:ankyrin repeat domain-containing protein [Bacteroidota bacterium]
MKKALLLLFFVVSTLTTFAHKEKWDDNKTNWSELMLAIYSGQTNKFTKLISEGADVNFRTNGSWKLTALDVAIRKDNEEAANALLSTNKVKQPEDMFMTACGQKSVKNVELLIKYGANVNDTLDNGYSMLMSAASFGSYEILDCLLKNGAKVYQTRKVDGMTPLMFAAFNGEPKKVALLLKYGANKNARDLNGKLALNYVDDIYEHLKISEKTKTEIRELLK